MPDGARLSALTRLACAEITSSATLEAAARACVQLVGDLIAGRPCQLDPVVLRESLARVLDAPAHGSRALSAQLAGAAALRRLDDFMEPPEPPSEAGDSDEPDPWFTVDLWSRLVEARGWERRRLSTREEHQLGRDWAAIVRSDDPTEALARYRKMHAQEGR